jgi:hypothetical protein
MFLARGLEAEDLVQMSQVLIHRRDAETQRRQMHFLCGLGVSAVNILAGLRWNLARIHHRAGRRSRRRL